MTTTAGRCRWDSDTKTYHREDGTECTVDGYGDPTHHCTMHRCSWHIGATEATCNRCIAGVRHDLRWITPLASLLLPQAITDGIDSEAANLAGPSVNPEAWSWRKVAAKQGVSWHISLEEEDDAHHPQRVLSTWAQMITDAYGHPMPDDATLVWCQDYLDRHLHRIAQDPDQDFPLLRTELRRCRTHLEAVLHNDDKPDRGVPCPECTSDTTGVGPRLTRVYAHWCDSPTCGRIHVPDQTLDRWVCPRDPDHAWTHSDYERWIAKRGQRRAKAHTPTTTTNTEANAV